MKKWYELVLMTIFLISCASNDAVFVSKKLNVSLGKYKRAFIDVQNVEYNNVEDRRSGLGTAAVDLDISTILRGLEIDPRGDEKRSGLKIECYFKYGWGMPRIGRHFSIKSKYITNVIIKLFDIDSKQLIGEVQYKRPWFENQQKDLIKLMFEKLTSTN